MKGFTMWAASTFFGLRWSSWETWLPLAAGMLVGVVSVVALRFLGTRQRIPAARPPPPEETPASDPFIHGTANEQRRAFRRGGNPVSVLIKRPEEKQPGSRGWVFDRSMGGLGLVVESEFEPGARLRVLPANAPQSTPWVDIQVRSCRVGEDGFELGCQFVKTPPWSVLLLFG